MKKLIQKTILDLKNIPCNDERALVAITPDGTKAITGSNDNTAKVWDRTT